MKPLVSVIIPTYNRAGMVCRAIDSVLEQTYPNVEIVVVDDGSTDDTLARIQRYGDRVQTITQKNAGPAAARNRGIEASRGEIVAFLDSDDLWLPSKLARQVALLERIETSVPCCLCSSLLRFSDGREQSSFEYVKIQPGVEEGIWLNATEILSARFVLFNQAVAVRREALERVGGFDESLWYLEDYDLALKLSLLGPWAVIPEPLVIWHQGSTGLSHKALAAQIQVTQNRIKIRERVVEEVQDFGQYSALRTILARELKLDYTELKAARLRQSATMGSRVAAKLTDWIGNYHNLKIRGSSQRLKAEVASPERFMLQKPEETGGIAHFAHRNHG